MDNEEEKYSKVLKDFMTSYANKDKDVTDKQWVREQLAGQDLPMSQEELAQYSDNLADSVASSDATLQSLREARAKGISREEWLAEQVQKSDQKYSEAELQAMADTMQCAYQQQLTNFQAEEMGCGIEKSVNETAAQQACIRDFNALAGEDGRYVASVDACDESSQYGQNQFDISINDNYTGQPLEKYLVRFGQTAAETVELVSQLPYAGEKVLVPAEQADEVRNALPGWDVVDHLGGSDMVSIAGNPLTDAVTTELVSIEVVETEPASASVVASAFKKMTRVVMDTGIISAGLTEGFERLENGEAVEDGRAKEMVETALKNGDVQGLKTAASVALATCVQKGMLKVLPTNTSPVVLAGIANTGIEGVNTAVKLCNGVITKEEAIEEFSDTAIVTFVECTLNKFATKATFLRLASLIPKKFGRSTVENWVASGILDKVGLVLRVKVLEVTREYIAPFVRNYVVKAVRSAKTLCKTAWNKVKNWVTNESNS